MGEKYHCTVYCTNMDEFTDRLSKMKNARIEEIMDFHFGFGIRDISIEYPSS